MSEKKKHPAQHLIAGGCSGLVESSCCHWIDTIKTRMQLRRQTTSVEKVVVKMRNSMMEPALRLKHSLQEPMLKPAGVHEPGLHLGGATATAAKQAVTRTSNITLHPHTVQAPLGPIGTARRIIEREGVLALYKVSLLIGYQLSNCRRRLSNDCFLYTGLDGCMGRHYSENGHSLCFL